MTDRQAAAGWKDGRQQSAGVLKLDAFSVQRNGGDSEAVFVIEDDISVREALCDLLRSVGIKVR